MRIPNFITHYHLADRQPFLSLSELKLGEQNSIFNNLLNRHKNDPGYHRRYGKDYIDKRKRIEDTLRCLFIERGGTPIRRYPVYFVLGQSTWFKHLSQNQCEIKISLGNLNPATTSFTFPDSYVALSSNTKPYHGKVFLLHELEYVIDNYGLPNDDTSLNYQKYWEGDFEKYIEFQIWEDDLIKPFIARYWKETEQSIHIIMN